MFINIKCLPAREVKSSTVGAVEPSTGDVDAVLSTKIVVVDPLSNVPIRSRTF